MGIPQDKFGVLIGLDEGTSSARISRYETGTNDPPIKTARNIAEALGVPLGYLYCDDDRLAQLILAINELPAEEQEELLSSVQKRLHDLRSNGT
jgi:transcriptional regulator with XRE-family HTH domain